MYMKVIRIKALIKIITIKVDNVNDYSDKNKTIPYMITSTKWNDSYNNHEKEQLKQRQRQ